MREQFIIDIADNAVAGITLLEALCERSKVMVAVDKRSFKVSVLVGGSGVNNTSRASWKQNVS